MPIITLNQAKLLIGIPDADTSRDALIEELIPEVEADYLRIRNKPFETYPKGDPKYPGGSKSVCADMITWILQTRFKVGLSHQGLEDFSETYTEDLVEGYPKSITRRITSYMRTL